MTTVIAVLANRCGLSNREAADYLDVRLDTFNSWSSPNRRNDAKPFAINALRSLYRTIAGTAEQALQAIRETAPSGSPVQLSYCADDHEARQLGLPYASCHRAMLGLVVAGLEGYAVELVPRGSTVGTAAAAAVHGR